MTYFGRWLALGWLCLACCIIHAGVLEDLSLLSRLETAPTARDYPRDDAVWLLRELDVTIDARGGTVVREHKLLKLLTPRALTLAHWAIPYDASRETLEVRIARTLLNGQTFPVDPAQVTEHAQYPGYAWYDALVVRQFPLPAAVVGAVLEVETVTRRPHPRVPDAFDTRLTLQQSLPLLEQRYTVRAPTAMPITLRFTGVLPRVQERLDKGQRVYAWSLRDTPPLRLNEPQTPPAADLAASARITSLTSWAPVVSWFQRITMGKDALTDDLRRVAAERTAGCATLEAKIAALHAAVRAMPYIAVELGELSDVPHSADEVLHRNYGDCKDKATLLRALLRAVDIPSDYVLVRTPGFGALDPALYGPGEFDHVMLAVRTPAGDRMLDAAAADSPAELLPPEVEGGQGLIVRGEGELVSLPVSSAADNRTDIHVAVTVNADGSAAGQATLTLTGQMAMLQRARLAAVPADGYRDALEGLLAPRLGNEVVVTAVGVEHANEPECPLLLTVTFTSPAYLQQAGTQWSGALPTFMSQPNRFRTTTERALPFRQRLESSLRLEAVITLPEGWLVTALPEAVQYAGLLGEYRDAAMAEGRILRYTCELAARRALLPPTVFDDVRRWSSILALEKRNGLQFFLRKP